MYAFFYSLYISLFLGEWTETSGSAVRTLLSSAWGDITNWLMNTIGGDFTTAQQMTWSVAPEETWALTLAFVTLTGLCWLVWRLTRLVFGVFFGGYRR